MSVLRSLTNLFKTNVRDTSLEAYEDIQPGLNRRQSQVFNFLSGVETATNAEIARDLGLPINQITPRIFELRKKNVVFEAGKRRCDVTGRTVYSWRI